jgi:hypothetical protein
VKLRLQSNSIRFRLKRGEVAQFAKIHRVKESVVMGKGSEFRYVLEASHDVVALQAHLETCGLVVRVPVETVRGWAEGSEVGIEAVLPVDGGHRLHVLIEKDFACLHGPSEENVDTFPHPLDETAADA